jgi:hypothetical protein
VRLLLTVLLAQIALLLWLLPKDLLIYLRIQHFFRSSAPAPPPDYAILLQNDPPLGFLLPNEEAGKSLRKITPKARLGYLIVPVGDCASCLSANLPEWQSEAPKHGLSMVLLSSATSKRVEQFRRSLGLTVPVISDPGDRLSYRLNMVWPARPYLFSTDWRLLWKARENSRTYNPFADQTLETALHGVQK